MLPIPSLTLATVSYFQEWFNDVMKYSRSTNYVCVANILMNRAAAHQLRQDKHQDMR
jgi:hypothetical protein